MAAQLRDVAGRLGGATARASVEAAGGAVRGVAWGVVGTVSAGGVMASGWPSPACRGGGAGPDPPDPGVLDQPDPGGRWWW